MSRTQEQCDLAEAVRSLLAKRVDSAAVRAAAGSARGFDEDLWATLCGDIGVAGLAVPAEFGGAGAGSSELAVVFEELGRALAPSPLLGSAVLAGLAVQESGDAAARERVLPAVAEGRVAALAWSPREGSWDPRRPACQARGSVVDGEAHYVLNGDSAELLIVAARAPGGVRLYEVDPRSRGVSCRAEPTLDRTIRLATVRFDGAAGRELSGEGETALARTRALAGAMLAAEQVGAATRSLELTVEHTKQRQQFGRPIGSFQALKHRMAEVHVAVEAARSAVEHAVSTADDRAPGWERAAHVARVSCTEALQHATAEMIQLHGGIAITWEHDAHLYFKRAHSSAQLLGQPEAHLRLLSADEGSLRTVRPAAAHDS